MKPKGRKKEKAKKRVYVSDEVVMLHLNNRAYMVEKNNYSIFTDSLSFAESMGKPRIVIFDWNKYEKHSTLTG